MRSKVCLGPVLRGLSAFIAAMAGFSGLALAQTGGQPVVDGARNFETYSPQFEIVRISKDEAPDIDGELTDEAWAKGCAD